MYAHPVEICAQACTCVHLGVCICMTLYMFAVWEYCVEAVYDDHSMENMIVVSVDR